MMVGGGGAGAPKSLGKASYVTFFNGLGESAFLLGESPFGFGFGLGGGLVFCFGSWTRFGSGIRRRPAGGHADEFNGSAPFHDVTECLGEDVSALSFSAGVGDPEDSPFPQVVQPRDVDPMGSSQVSHGRVLAGLDDLIGALVVLDEVEDNVAFEDRLPQVE